MDFNEYLKKIKFREILNYFEMLIRSGVNTVAELSLSSRYYDWLKPYVRHVLKFPNIKCDIVFTYMLVQYTMREYSGTDFYTSFCNAMGGPTIDPVYIKEIVKGTIKHYNLQEFGYFSAKRIQYVECVKAHSFAYFAKQEGFLDSSRKIYEWLGCNIQDKEIVKRELFFIQQKTKLMSSSVKDDNDVELVFGDDRNGRKAPRLYMAASTFRFFSNVSIDALMRVYYPILQLIDDWYYPDDEPNQIAKNRIGWIEQSYKKWSESQNNNITNTSERRQKSPYRNHMPSYRIDPSTNKDTFKIVVPEIIKEAPANNEKWYCEIRNDGKVVVESFELLISEELSFENIAFWKTGQVSINLDWSLIFSDLSIIVYQTSNNDDSDEIVSEWTISKSVYRLFDVNGYQIKKIQANKENILLIASGSGIEDKDISNIRRSTSIYFDKVQFLASSDAAIKIGDSAIISVAGQYYAEPFFAEERNSILIEKDGARIVAARRHPDISISCVKGEESSIKVTINGTPRRWLDKNNYKVIPDITDENRIIVTFSIDNFFFNEDTNKVASNVGDDLDGIYTIEYGVQGKPTKTITYIILQSLSFRFSRPRFYDSNCELKISREYSLIPVENDFFSCVPVNIFGDSYWDKYNLTIKPQCEEIRFKIVDFDVLLIIPVRKAVFSFSSDIADAVFFHQQSYIPFTQIRNTMDVVISGAQEMVLECNGIECLGQVINLQKGYFRFDLSVIKNSFHSTIPEKMKIKYHDNKERKKSILIQSIKPWPIQWCVSLDGNILYYRLDEIASGATCCFDLFENESDESLITSIPLCVNEQQKLFELESNKTYWYRRKITVPNIIPGLSDDSFFVDDKKYRLPLFKLDIDNLVGVKMDIFDGKKKYLYRYTVKIVKKVSTNYLGYLYEDDHKKYNVAVYDFVEKNNNLSAKIAYYSVEEKRRYQLALRDYQLIALKLEPNDYYFTFDRNSFRKGEI